MIMRKIVNKIGRVLQIVLAAPVKLPGKLGNILKYLAVGLGIAETVLDNEERPAAAEHGADPNAKLSGERSEDDEDE